MHWDAIWCILRHNFEKCYSVCTNLVASWWFFRYSYLYTVLMTIFLGGEAGHFGGGKRLPLKYPRKNPEKSSIPTGLFWTPIWPPWRHLKRSITRQYSLWNIKNYLRMTISQLCIKQICLPSIISNVTSNTTNFVEFGWRVDNVWIVLALCFGLVTTPARKSTSLKTSWPMPHPKQIFRKSSE